MEILPNFLALGVPTNYDNSIERTAVQEVHPNTINFNTGAQLNFSYDGSELYRLSSNATGFRCTFAFLTQGQNNANESAADITLANNFFSNFFDKIAITLGNREIESFTNPGVVTDILAHMKESEYREKSGALHSFIPDENTGAANEVPVASSFTTGQAFAAAAAQNHTVTNSATFNRGYRSRKSLYNYAVAANDTARTVQLFVPLNALLGNCKENDKVLKHIKFNVQLVVAQATTMPRCYFGAANTNMVFSGNDRGLTSIVLELELVYPRPEIMLELEHMFQKPLTFTYLSRWSDLLPIGAQKQFTYRQAFSKANQGLPRYCFVALKRDQPESAQTNFSRCCHCDVQNLFVRYLSNKYPYLDQNAEFGANQFAKFYSQFAEVSKSLGHSTGLAMKEFCDLYTIFAVDLSSQKLSTGGDLTVEILRRAVPANNNAEQNPRDVIGYVLFFCEKSIKIDALKQFVTDD